jgi:dihydrodipicolinate synthase/N-acetylneuraminate lyase
MTSLKPASAPDLDRRDFLQFLGAGAGALGLALAGVRSAKAETDPNTGASSAIDVSPGPKKLRGLFPIIETPFTPDNQLDLDGLAAEVTFCNRGSVHGMMWPQLASGWSTLSEAERISGAEAMLAAGKGGYSAIVIGVQGADMGAVTRYAQHAAKNGADAIISLPPANVSDEKALLAYYQQVGALTDLPLFAQCTGTMSIDLVVEMFKTIPTMRQVKDEAGVPLERIAELRRRTDDQLRVFSGQGVRTMINEMEAGFVGHCPYTGLADVYAAAFDLWHGGKRQEGFDMFGRICAFTSMGMVDQNRLLIDRGVFKPDTKFRTPSGAAGVAAGGGGGGGGGRGAAGPRLNDKAARQALNRYMKSSYKA